MSGDPYCEIHGFLPCICWYWHSIEPKKDTFEMKSFDQLHTEDEKKKFQRRNLLARMAGNIAAGSAKAIARGDISVAEIRDVSVRLAQEILDKLDKEE